MLVQVRPGHQFIFLCQILVNHKNHYSWRIFRLSGSSISSKFHSCGGVFFYFLKSSIGANILSPTSRSRRFFMVRKYLVVAAAMATISVPVLLLAQTSTNGAPLGSKENPIKGTLVSTSAPTGHKSTTKRGTKTNPITGSTHPRGTNPN